MGITFTHGRPALDMDDFDYYTLHLKEGPDNLGNSLSTQTVFLKIKLTIFLGMSNIRDWSNFTFAIP